MTIRTDITALKQAEAKLRRLAEHDPLTGLANRAVLLQRISDAKDQGRHMAEPGKLILFDIDHFKAVNDGLGHAIGDLLLRIVARRLKRLLPPHCTAARLGGDEFALVAPGVTAAELPEFMGRLFAHLKRPMRLGRARYTPSISAGVTRLHADEKGQGTDTMIRAGALLSRADAALQEAKKQGRARWVRHDNVLAARIARRIRLADRLRTAIAQDRLEIAIQPQEDLATGRIKGFEALARWQDEGQWVPPPEFVGIAEDSGQAQALGNRILDKALAAQARMLADGLAPGLMAVNVSTAQLLAEDFPETIRRLLAKHGLSPAQLELEITETVLLDHSAERIASILEDLRSRGISLSLDDFGTGYASMAHVSRFPVHRIKIDRSFVSGIGVCRPSHDAARNGGLVARSLILLGRGLGLDVVAEGVETEAQKRYLAARGCTTMQGWLLARPMAPEAAHQWLATREQRRAKASASMAASRRHRLCTT